MTEVAYLQEVRSQYEQLPYPHRDPKLELERLVPTTCEQLSALNFYGYGGKQSFRGGYRVLVAGGGTGDPTLFLAEQLAGTGAEIIHLDISTASIDVAKERARVRGLTDITFIHGSLLEVEKLGIGPFDYINCTGVLHHLEDPLAGLKALTAVLKDDGLMGLMVYGQYGRTGVYQMQSLLRMLTAATTDTQGKLDTARQVLASLPKSNWLQHNQEVWSSEVQQDAGLYDLLLHSQDRAYTVPEVYAWVESAGLHLLELMHPKGSGRFLYDPAAHIRSPELLAHVRKMPKRERQAIAELMSGQFSQHLFYAAKSPRERASAADQDMVPFVSDYRYQDPQRIAEEMDGREVGKVLVMKFEELGIPIVMLRQSHTPALLREIDGTRTLGEIIDAVAARTGAPREELSTQLVRIFNELNIHDVLFLRHRSVSPFPGRAEMDARPKTRPSSSP